MKSRKHTKFLLVDDKGHYVCMDSGGFLPSTTDPLDDDVISFWDFDTASKFALAMSKCCEHPLNVARIDMTVQLN